MKIRIMQAFQGYKRGQEFDWPDGMARVFVARGLVEEVGGGQPEAASLEADSEKASLSHRPRKKRTRE